eukprot:350084-Chlamydomonas_euryale.AAC.1
MCSSSASPEVRDEPGGAPPPDTRMRSLMPCSRSPLRCSNGRSTACMRASGHATPPNAAAAAPLPQPLHAAKSTELPKLPCENADA